MGNFNVDVFGQYNTQLNRFVQTTVGGGWRPTTDRTLNFGYRNVWTPPVSASPENNLTGRGCLVFDIEFKIFSQISSAVFNSKSVAGSFSNPFSLSLKLFITLIIG
jgi:hypothetical protein